MTVTLGRVVTGRGHEKGSWSSGAVLFLDLGAGDTEYVPFCENRQRYDLAAFICVYYNLIKSLKYIHLKTGHCNNFPVRLIRKGRC